MRRSLLPVVLLLGAASFAPVRCMQVVRSEPRGTTDPRTESIGRALEILDRGARAYPERRQCFACHHQTLPALAFQEAGHWLDFRNAERIGAIDEFVSASFRERIRDLEAGESIGGKGLTVGYGLWTLRLTGHRPDATTRAMVEYLLKTQLPTGSWELHSIRPPAEESVSLATLLAAAGLAHFADESQRERRDLALQRAREWLVQCATPLHEDRVARAWGWKLLGGSRAARDAARDALLSTQREDGGWSQTGEGASDAYATATALYALLETGLPSREPGIVRGLDWLRKNQQPDGSWHVATRATPVQVFFDNGDPHGKDQFISMMATGWSAAVLLRTTDHVVPGTASADSPAAR